MNEMSSEMNVSSSAEEYDEQDEHDEHDSFSNSTVFVHGVDAGTKSVT